MQLTIEYFSICHERVMLQTSDTVPKFNKVPGNMILAKDLFMSINKTVNSEGLYGKSLC